MSILIEVAVATLEDATIVESSGADRLELCSALELGGLTPSLGILQTIKQTVSLPVVAMARPRAGGFVYSASDFLTMQRDVDLLLQYGAAGIVFGCLTGERTLDLGRIQQLVRQIGPAESVFHRAFDVAADPLGSLEGLIDLGVTRVLTSGQRPSAMDGVELIRQLVDRAAGRIQILPGGGISPENAAELVKRTGVTQIHGSFSEFRDDPAFPVCSGQYQATSARQIRSVRATFKES